MPNKLALLCALLVLVLACVALCDLAPVKADDEAIQGVTWLTDLDQARAKARETGRPILAVFR